MNKRSPKGMLIALMVISACNNQKNQVEVPLPEFEFHRTLNSKYADPEQSPLTEEDLEDFKSLKFFLYNEEYKLKASFTLTPDAPVFEMKTSTDRLPLYRKYAELRFKWEGQEQFLEAYRNQEYIDHPVYGKELFIPFLDETNGIETYGGGRYLDLTIPETDTDSVWLDFNRSYNPYCAYNYKYSCPKPPEANHLDIRIEAGVQTGIYKK